MQDTAHAAVPPSPDSSEDGPDVRGRATRSSGARTVLLAEDDPVVRHVIRLLLELQGDIVLEAEDGLAAVARARAYHGRIDLLVTDIMMPGLNGAEVCAQIREQYPLLPTLFISGYYPDAVFPGQRLPARSAFLAKPFMPEELGDAVARLLAPRDRGHRLGA